MQTLGRKVFRSLYNRTNHWYSSQHAIMKFSSLVGNDHGTFYANGDTRSGISPHSSDPL
jgi:hypothetical protein